MDDDEASEAYEQGIRQERNRIGKELKAWAAKAAYRVVPEEPAKVLYCHLEAEIERLCGGTS